MASGWVGTSVAAGACLLLVLASASQSAHQEKAPRVKQLFQEPPAAFNKPNPANLADLQAIQEHIKRVIDFATPATVSINYSGKDIVREDGAVLSGTASGVIVSDSGYVLTAAHITGLPNKKVQLILHDDRRVQGITLGCNRTLDIGLIQITTPGKWSYVDMGHSRDVKKGDWCVALGHPNGYQKGRAPVVRLGRVRELMKNGIQTDCTIVGGDSGGPLIDMRGRVIGTHNRIGAAIDMNIHAPVDGYHDLWERLLKGEILK